MSLAASAGAKFASAGIIIKQNDNEGINGGVRPDRQKVQTLTLGLTQVRVVV